MVKRVVSVICMLLLVALGPALVASAAPTSAPEAPATWWSSVSNWWASVVEAVTSVSATSQDEGEESPDPTIQDTLPEGPATEAGPSMDPDG